MNLWLLTAGVFLLGSILAGLRERARQVQPVPVSVAQAAGIYSIYILVVGLLMAFNLFQLERIDPFFVNSRGYVFRVLYWPSWVLTFAPLVIAGVVVVVAFGIQRARRVMALMLLLAVTLTALETVFLLEVGAVGKVFVQGAVFAIFTGWMYAASRFERV